MFPQLFVDASEIDSLSRSILKLPGDIKAKAMARAMRRMRDMARTRVVKRSSERTDVPPRMVRALTTATFNAGGNTIEVIEKSGWISLYRLGATQTKSGVRVRARGSYKSAFIGQMSNGHRGVLKRVGKERLPIRELFGPNPAHDVTNNPEVYLKVLAELINDALMPRLLHELAQILPK